MRAIILFLAAAFAFVSPATADPGSLVARYYAALKMEDVFDILRDEGIESALKTAEEDESITASPAWTSRVNNIYTIEKMDAAFRHGIEGGTALEASEEALLFFESALGRRIVDIELDARRALGDDDVEAAMREKVLALAEENPNRLKMYEAFISVNNLVDSNVMGALNSNLAFYRGLGTNPLFGTMDESTMLAQVYEQEADIREDMEDWTMNFSALAYALLTDDELADYIAISDSRAGQIMNTALFAGFDKVFEMHSFELGRAMAEFMEGDDT